MHLKTGGGLGRTMGTLFLALFVLTVLLPGYLQAFEQFIRNVAPYIAGAVGLFLLVVIVLRLLNEWRGKR
jgi:hypothetical protein